MVYSGSHFKDIVHHVTRSHKSRNFRELITLQTQTRSSGDEYLLVLSSFPTSAVQGPHLGNVPLTSKVCFPLSIIFIKITPCRRAQRPSQVTTLTSIDNHGCPLASVPVCRHVLSWEDYSMIWYWTTVYTGRHRSRDAWHISSVRETVLMRLKKFGNTVSIHQNVRIDGAFLCSCKTAAGASDLQGRKASPIFLSSREAESFAFWARTHSQQALGPTSGEVCMA